MSRYIAGACCVGVVAAAIVAAAQSPPAAPQLTGEAMPPASALSLWYRAPASDHPLLPVDAPRQSRQAGTAEWVKIVALSGSIPDARLSSSRLRTLARMSPATSRSVITW